MQNKGIDLGKACKPSCINTDQFSAPVLPDKKYHKEIILNVYDSFKNRRHTENYTFKFKFIFFVENLECILSCF